MSYELTRGLSSGWSGAANKRWQNTFLKIKQFSKESKRNSKESQVFKKKNQTIFKIFKEFSEKSSNFENNQNNFQKIYIYEGGPKKCFQKLELEQPSKA